MNWSHYQKDIFAAVHDSRDSLIIEAVAGSGKTSTIIECTNHVAAGERIAFLAFNKSIASELGRRITAGNARCMTLHAAGFAAWKQGLGWDANDCRVDGKKTWGIVEDTLSWPDRKKFGAGIVKLVGLAKGIGIVPHVLPMAITHQGLVPDTKEAWESLMDHHGIDEEDTDIELARRVLGESIARAREVIDFDDMLYMPVVAGAAFEKYDVVFLDEAQDVNAMQVEMVGRMLAPPQGLPSTSFTDEAFGGRLIAVGDPNQAIYGFRGAGTDAMTELGRRFGCRSLPLSVSYRCPRRVVEHARRWVPRIEWAEDAPEGIVELDGGGSCVLDGESPSTARGWGLKCFQPGDAILCRVTRPLVALAFRLIRAKVACRVIGWDIGAGMTGLVKKLGRTWLVPGATQDGFRTAFQVKLDGYRVRETGRLTKRREPALLAGLHDRLDTLQVFVDELGDGDGIEELISSISALFRDAEAGGIDGARTVNLSTMHKFKGMEANRVFILDASQYMPSPWARAGWERQQELNCCYVAATRARRELRYVESEGL